jgi:formylglycine-generating enzyme required for sulfatase activity
MLRARTLAAAAVLALAAALPLCDLALRAQPPKQPAGGKKVALLVGVNVYQNRKLDDLKYAEADVTELAEVLRGAGFEVRVLLGSAAGADAATKANVEAAVAAVLKGVTKKDTVLLGFAGHGQQLFVDADEGGARVKKEVPFFCPKDAVPADPGTLVSLSAVLKDLDDRGGGHNLLLVDACRDVADPRRGMRGGIDSSKVEALNEGTAVFLACASRQMARETDKMFDEARRKEGKGHGVFFHFVIEGLKGGAKNDAGDVTWERLVPYVKGRVKDEFPKWFEGSDEAERQRPQSLGNLTDDPILVSARDIARREPRPGEVRKFEIAAGVFMEFCYVPAGECQLGSPKAERDAVLYELKETNKPEWLDEEDEGVRGKFQTKGFWLGRYEVTQAEWTAVMGSNPSTFDGKKDNKAIGLDTRRFPIETVSWDDCQTFLRRVNGDLDAIRKTFGARGRFRLPHEDEWEYAFRGGKGNGRSFYWGNSLNGTEANCVGTNPFGTATEGRYLGRPCPVDETNGGKYELHPWGLCHMAGNVDEWCNNEYSKDTRVLRGGSWISYGLLCRAANRSRSASDDRIDVIGFRVCLPLD